MNILPSLNIKGSIILPGDKSIAHRAIILGAISSGKTVINNFPANEDCKSSLVVLRSLGVKIKKNKNGNIIVFGKGLNGLIKPDSSLFIEESGTTFRLLLGILAAQKFETKLTAGKALSKRPMLRVIAPLRKMGASISGEYPPIFIRGSELKGITYNMPVASAQVKSAVLLAGLYAIGETRIIEPIKTRDHTERMLCQFRAGIKRQGDAIVIKGGQVLISPGSIYVPGDLSSAAFFIVAAAILRKSKILIRRVSLNPTRLGIVKVLKRMGADIEIEDRSSCLTGRQAKLGKREPIGDILVKSSRLKGVRVLRKDIPSLIDELPILMVAASCAKGETIFEGVGELRVKETDRINSMTSNLKKMGADIRVVKVGESENIVIQGGNQLKGAKLKSFGDHRTAMSAIIAGLAASGKSSIDNVSCINKSFPEFLRILNSLM
ncbi:MAG: 3-phosphoshikimate 1-carboxyvinyltransferase [Candidatus Omnitrophota bacterium]|jgi:3-phosphoshikimate 1-carboxyvinyltransferase